MTIARTVTLCGSTASRQTSRRDATTPGLATTERETLDVPPVSFETTKRGAVSMRRDDTRRFDDMSARSLCRSAQTLRQEDCAPRVRTAAGGGETPPPPPPHCDGEERRRGTAD